MAIQFWFEFASTYSYPAALRIESQCRERGIDVEWRPFLLGPIFAALGWNDSPFNIFPSKGRYMWRDLERLCMKYGFGFQEPSVFPRSGLLAARVACLGADRPWLPDFVRAVYRANFAEDLEISRPEVIQDLLEALGEPGDAILREAQSAETKARLRRGVEEARDLGIFGAPSFIVRGELFWGQDRLDDALAWHDAVRG